MLWKATTVSSESLRVVETATLTRRENCIVPAFTKAFYTLKPKPRMQARWFASASLHFPSAWDGSYLRKQSSRAALVSGHAQQLHRGVNVRRMRLGWVNARLKAFGVKRIYLRVCRVISFRRCRTCRSGAGRRRPPRGYLVGVIVDVRARVRNYLFQHFGYLLSMHFMKSDRVPGNRVDITWPRVEGRSIIHVSIG